MRIAIGSDHRGFDLKEGLKELLGELGHEWVDIGCQGEEPVVDYPDIARPLAQAVARGELDVGILICLTRENEKGLYAVVPDLPEAVRNPSRLHRRRLGTPRGGGWPRACFLANRRACELGGVGHEPVTGHKRRASSLRSGA